MNYKANYTALILAGGLGTRMKSPLPKVLHPVAGQPMIARIITQCQQAGIDHIRVVVGHGHALVKSVIDPYQVLTFFQENQLGTADAVKSAKPSELSGHILILNGDHPLVSAEDMKSFMTSFEDQDLDLAVVSVDLSEPKDFGRIIRSDNQLKGIVEAKDASSEVLKIKEINTGIYLAKAEVLNDLLPQITNLNSKKEYYLTDIIKLALEKKYKVSALKSARSDVSHGVNSQIELAQATKKVFLQKAHELLDKGVIIIDPESSYIEETVHVAAGTVIYPQVFIKGKTAIGPFCVLEPSAFIVDSILHDGVQVKAGTYIEQSVIKAQVKLGPYARIRPDSIIGEKAQIGNFVELKKVNFGAHSKAGHLTYLGDAEIGEHVNIGCGTITCNYAADKKKYKTKIGNRVFVGSDTQFVAPIEVGDDSIIASGSTITQNVPNGALAIGRSKQQNKENYAAKFKPKNELS